MANSELDHAKEVQKLISYYEQEHNINIVAQIGIESKDSIKHVFTAVGNAKFIINCFMMFKDREKRFIEEELLKQF
ncbi:hypothetical protein V9L05_08780 [Bernardetia sp. Wsw4-3y2]|uniref:hypothetical protein n=1 Tax=Bernardetia sp. Wsw4-3y2 TaxID=3127471 RepID=UPI0030D04E6B